MKVIILAAFMLINISAFAQKINKEPARFEFMPLINDDVIEGKITNKYVTIRAGNPACFIVVNKMHIYLVYDSFFEKLKVGDEYSFKGLKPLNWKPDNIINDRRKSVPTRAVADDEKD